MANMINTTKTLWMKGLFLTTVLVPMAIMDVGHVMANSSQHPLSDQDEALSLVDKAQHLAASDVKRTIWRRRGLDDGQVPDDAMEMPEIPQELLDEFPELLDIPGFGDLQDLSDMPGLPPLPSGPPANAPRNTQMGDIEMSQDGGKAKISLEIKGMDILDVLKILAKKSGLNIVAGRNVRGNVTIFLKDIEIWEALITILETYDLAYEVKNNMIQVMTEADYQRLHGTPFHDKTEVEFIHVKYAKVGELQQELNLVKTKLGKVIIDDRTNTLVLIDSPAGIRDIREVVQKLDVPVVTKSFALEHTDVLKIEEMVQDLVSSAGKLTVDKTTNKLVVTDAKKNVDDIERLIAEYDQTTRLVTRVYALQYANFSEVEGKISDILTPDIGIVISDERTNAIAVTDLPDKIGQLDELMDLLDKKEKQVLIESTIIQITLDDEFQMGVNWETLFEKEFGGLELKNVFTRSLTTGTTLGWGVTDLAGVFGTIQVLKKLGKTDILSEPRIVTINNKPARIHVGTNEAFITSDVTQNNNTTTTSPNVDFQEVGVQLEVTPRINDDGFIIMEIRPEVSSVSRTVELFNDSGQKISEVPIVRTSETETTVMVRSGQTVMIGGLIDDSFTKEKNQIPFLGSLPLIGAAFRDKKQTLKKTELVVFITPTVLKDEYHEDAERAASEHQRMLKLKEILDHVKPKGGGRVAGKKGVTQP